MGKVQTSTFWCPNSQSDFDPEVNEPLIRYLVPLFSDWTRHWHSLNNASVVWLLCYVMYDCVCPTNPFNRRVTKKTKQVLSAAKFQIIQINKRSTPQPRIIQKIQHVNLCPKDFCTVLHSDIYSFIIEETSSRVINTDSVFESEQPCFGICW